MTGVGVDDAYAALRGLLRRCRLWGWLGYLWRLYVPLRGLYGRGNSLEDKALGEGYCGGLILGDEGVEGFQVDAVAVDQAAALGKSMAHVGDPPNSRQLQPGRFLVMAVLIFAGGSVTCAE